MSTTFDKVAEIIAETCDIPRENIKPESHAINDLEIDSLDFLDIAFAIDKAFGIGPSPAAPLGNMAPAIKHVGREPLLAPAR